MIGRTLPASIQGQTAFSTSRASRALSSGGRGRSVEPVTTSRLRMIWLRSTSAFSPPSTAIWTSRPPGFSTVMFSGV